MDRLGRGCVGSGIKVSSALCVRGRRGPRSSSLPSVSHLAGWASNLSRHVPPGTMILFDLPSPTLPYSCIELVSKYIVTQGHRGAIPGHFKQRGCKSPDPWAGQ